jgi:hypothetical protein
VGDAGIAPHLTIGPDGNLWFTHTDNHFQATIGRYRLR